MSIKCLICLIAVTVLVLAGLVIFIYCRCRRHKKAACKVHKCLDGEKMQMINQALEPFGFGYDLYRDIFYSLEHAWQKNMGYGKIYDEMAPAMNMEIHCEPVYFTYRGRRFMIELWKGQYGVTTGAEMGIYVEKEYHPDKKPEDVFYECVEEKDYLYMNMRLWKNGKKLFERGKSHWWLTGFVLGTFSYPGELLLEASITFPTPEMREAFVEGCYRAGYRPEDLHIWCSSVSLTLCSPKTPQPSRYWKCFWWWIRFWNKHNCKLYCRVTKKFDRTIDKICYLMLAYPRIFKTITKLGRMGWSKK